MCNFVHSTNDICETPLHKACLGGHLEIVQELLKYEPNINAVTQGARMEAWTPLMCAAFKGHFKIVEELMKHGADIDFSDPKYGSAMHLAMESEQVAKALELPMENEHEQIVKILLKNGCNTKVRAKLTFDDVDLPDFTPFEMALDMESIDIVKMIAYHET